MRQLCLRTPGALESISELSAFPPSPLPGASKALKRKRKMGGLLSLLVILAGGFPLFSIWKV
jgi:hypothetical protein